MNKKFIESLAGVLKLDAEELAQVIASEEEATMKLPEGNIYSDEDIETLKDNHGKDRYEAGKVAEREVTYKNLSKEAGLETIKDHKEFMKAYQAKVLEEAAIEPEKQVAELQTSLKALQTQVEEKENAYSELQNSVQADKTKFEVTKSIPDLPKHLGIDKDEATDLFFRQHDIKDGVPVKKDGTPLKDHLERPLSVEQAVQSFVKERGWNAVEPEGRGGGAGGSRKIATFEDFEDELKEKGINPSSAEAAALLQEAAKDNPEILD